MLGFWLFKIPIHLSDLAISVIIIRYFCIESSWNTDSVNYDDKDGIIIDEFHSTSSRYLFSISLKCPFSLRNLYQKKKNKHLITYLNNHLFVV